MTCLWWLKMELGVEFVKQPIGMLNQTIDIWEIIKTLNPSYLAFLDAEKLYGWAMSQKLPVNGFE